MCACTFLGALWHGGEMQRCCAEGAPQIKHGVISKVPTVKMFQMLGLAVEKQ